MADNEYSDDSELSDPESISFVGPPKAPAELDFEAPLWLVEIEYPRSITQHIVNANSREEASATGLEQAHQSGEPVHEAVRIDVAHMEKPGGDNAS